MARRGNVSLSGIPVGTIEEVDGKTQFNYLPEWLSRQDARPVSLTLPLRPEPYVSEGLHPFFENLLKDSLDHMRSNYQSKRASFPLSLEADKWYTLRAVVEGDVMRVSLDGKLVGEFRSEGIAHPTKRMITLAVNKSAWVDDVKVWKRK